MLKEEKMATVVYKRPCDFFPHAPSHS